MNYFGCVCSVSLLSAVAVQFRHISSFRCSALLSVHPAPPLPPSLPCHGLHVIHARLCIASAQLALWSLGYTHGILVRRISMLARSSLGKGVEIVLRVLFSCSQRYIEGRCEYKI